MCEPIREFQYPESEKERKCEKIKDNKTEKSRLLKTAFIMMDKKQTVAGAFLILLLTLQDRIIKVSLMKLDL